MKFAQFYHLSTGYIAGTIPPVFDEVNKKPIPVCGSDGVAYLDGRWKLEKQAKKAREVCKQRGFLGFALYAGDSLLRARQTRAFEIV